MAEYLSTHTGLRVDEAIAKIPDGNPGDKSVVVVNTNGKPEYAPVTTGVSPSTIPIRDTAGRIQAAAPVDVNDVANKQYVGDNFVKIYKPTSGTHAYVCNKYNYSTVYRITVESDAWTLVARKDDGRIETGDPVAAMDAVNKQYFGTNIPTFSVEVW